jgi:acetyl esterase
MVEMALNAYAPAGTDRTDPRCSPLLGDLARLPPAYVLASEYDFLRDEEQAYADALRDAGVDVTYHCWPGTVHNFFSMHDHLDIARTAMAEAAAALRGALHP